MGQAGSAVQPIKSVMGQSSSMVEPIKGSIYQPAKRIEDLGENYCFFKWSEVPDIKMCPDKWYGFKNDMAEYYVFDKPGDCVRSGCNLIFRSSDGCMNTLFLLKCSKIGELSVPQKFKLYTCLNSRNHDRVVNKQDIWISLNISYEDEFRTVVRDEVFDVDAGWYDYELKRLD